MLVYVEVQLKVLLVRQFDPSLSMQNVEIGLRNGINKNVFESAEIYFEVVAWTCLELDFCELSSQLFYG